VVELDAGDGVRNSRNARVAGWRWVMGAGVPGGVCGVCSVVIVMVSSGGVGELAMCRQCDTAARSAVISAISSCWSESSRS